MRFLWTILATALLAACAAYSGRGLEPGEAKLEDVVRVMGQAAMRWQDADGSIQLAYPRGPMGFHSYMAYIGPDGRLQRIENVMDTKAFALNTGGHDKEPGGPHSGSVRAILDNLLQGARRTGVGMALLRRVE